MNKVIFLIVCFSVAIFAQNVQNQQGQYQQYPPQQNQQGQYQQYPLQQNQQGQYQQYPPQQFQQQSNTEHRDRVQRLIREGVKRNKEEIQKESFYLSPADRDALYDRNKKKGAGIWAALDFLVGFGVGSYIQGDMIFGPVQTGLDVIAWSLMANADSGDMALSGLTIYGASRICSWIFPFGYQKRYNRNLKNALNGNNVSYSIDPLIVPKDGAPAVGLAFNVRY